MCMKKKEEKKILRIAHFNILKGGERRLLKIFKVIDEINPDICGILEAVDWQKNNSFFKKKVKEVGYKIYNLALANSKYNIAVFSKISISIKHIKKDFHHVVVQVTPKEGKYEGLSIFFIHLSPVSEDDRLMELNKLLKYINKFPRSIIMGDFNSLSEHDLYNKRKLLSFFKKNKIKKYGVESLRFDVIKKIESFGLVDSMKYLKTPWTFSVPTSSNIDINHSVKMRVDYAFLTKNILKYLNKAEIFKNKPSDSSSDHYPFFIELK